MGTTSSRQQSKQDGWNTSLSHSISMPSSRSRSEATEGRAKVPWKFQLSSMQKLTNRESSLGSIFGLSSNLRPVQEEEFDEVQGNDLEGHFDEMMHARKVSVSKANLKSLRRSVSFQPAWEPNPDCLSRRKSFRESPSASNLSLKLDSVTEFGDSPPQDVVMDKSLGLRTLLKPVLTSSRSFASPARLVSDFANSMTPRGNCSTHGGDKSPDMKGFLARSGSFRNSPTINKVETRPEWMWNSDSLVEPGTSPLFDPSILASFEEALQVLSDESQLSSDFSTNENSSSTSETSSDADSPQLVKEEDNTFEGFGSLGYGNGILANPSALRANTFLNRKFSFSRVFSLKNDDKNWSGKDYLDRFEKRCPPASEGKVILYFTSLRAIRKTFEDCCMLRLILKGLRVRVDERDVWLHSKFRQELTEVMGTALPVPRLFILGRHIGGAEEVELLHEEGILAKMLEDLPTESRQVCDICGDVRFIPCITCCGSCKTVSEEDVVERCPDCNENGLIMCPSCDS